MVDLKYNKSNLIKDLEFKTKEAACFDICSNETVTIPSNEAKLITTGLTFDIPKGYSLRVYLRSGWAFDNTATLLNSEGIIDSDYTGVVKLPIFNLSHYKPIYIQSGDRIAQAELVKQVETTLIEVYEIEKHTERGKGGFGHTGKH